MASRFEAAHRSLTLSSLSVRILGAVVQSPILAMLHTRECLAFGCPITGEFISEEHTRHVLAALEQLPEEFEGCSFVAPVLQQDIEHVSLLIDGTLQIVQLAIDGEKYLVKMPFVTRLRSPPT